MYGRPMGTRTSHPPGTFSWADLATSDAGEAKAFYTGVFGWTPEDMPVPDAPPYTMLRVGDTAVAALYGAREGQPSAWLSYVTVEDADATAAKARELGATLMAEPMDVMEAGRMAIVQDPQGAVFAIWQPRGAIGAERVNEPNCMTWNELATPDMGASGSFYSDLFGWRIEDAPGAEGRYATILNGDRTNGGIRPLQDGEPMPWWAVYFAVEDLDASLGRAAELGGATLAGPMEVLEGRRIAAVRDPHGAVFNLYEGDLDD